MHHTVSFSHLSTAVILGLWLCTQLTSPAVAQDQVRAKVGIQVHSGARTAPAKTTETVKTGDSLRVYVVPENDAYVYVVHNDGKNLTLLNYFISTLFALLIPTSYLINEQYKFFWGYYPRAGLLHPLFLVYFLWVTSLSLRKLYRGYQANEGQSELEATRIKFAFLAFTVGYAACIDFVQSYGIEFYPMGYLFVTLMAMIICYSILKFQVMDIAPAGTRTRYAYCLWRITTESPKPASVSCPVMDTQWCG